MDTSDWTEVRGGVLQGSVLGPLLFTILIYDINEKVLYEIYKFSDDTKIASQINTLDDVRSMERTLDKLGAWANRWEIKFNVNKYGVMHIGKGNIVSVSDEWWLGQISRWREGHWSVNV